MTAANPFDKENNPFSGQNNPFSKGEPDDKIPDNPVGPQDADAFTDAGMNNTSPETTKPRVIPGGANPADASQPPGGIPPVMPVMPMAAPMATPSVNQGLGGTPNMTPGGQQ